MSLPTLQQLIEEKDSKTVVARIIIGGTELPDWITCTYQFDIGTVPTATITVPGLANLPNSVQEEAQVQIWFGYKVGVTTLTQLVFGGAIVDSIGNNGSEITITCVMDGPRKLSYSYNRRIAFDFDNVTAVESVTALMALAGVTNFAVNLDPWLIGTVVPYTSALGNQIQFSSYGDAINKVSEVDGSPWYAMPTGQVRVEKRDPIPSPSARRTYFTSILTGPVESQPLGIGNPLARPRITDITKNQLRRDVANFIEVDGAVVVTLGPNGEQNSDQIKETVDGISGQFPNGAYWIPTPPLFQDFNFSNELIDTNAKAFEVCERYFDLKNRLFEDLPITVPGDPDVFLGETVAVKDPMYSGTASLYFVKGYTTTIEQNSCVTTLNLTGGPESGTTGFAAPFADFIWTYDAFITPGGSGGSGGKDNSIKLPPNTDLGAKLCEDFPDPYAPPTPTTPEQNVSYASDTPGNAVVYIGLNGTVSQDFDGYIVSWIWTWTDHLAVDHTVSGSRWTLIVDPDTQSSVEVTLTVTDNSGRTDTVIKTIRTSVNYVPDPTNPDQPYDPTNGKDDTQDGGGTSIGPCSEPQFPNPYGPDGPGSCEGLEKLFLVAAKTVAMASFDNRTWNDLTKAAAGASGDFISVDGGVNNATQVGIAIFGTDAGEIVRSIDNCVTGTVVFTVPGGPRIECIHFDTQEMGTPGGDTPDASPTPINGEVPVYTFASPGTLTIAQAYQQCRLVGFSHDTAIVAVGIMVRESGLYSKAVNTAGNTPPSTDRGIAQWNDFYHPDISDACAYNTECAITQMYKKSAGGSDFSPWNVRGGSYLTGVDLSAVQAVVGNLTGDVIAPGTPSPTIAPSSMKIWAGTSDGRIYISDDSGKNWTLHVEFADGSPILEIGTPAGPSLWAFGGDTGEISSLVRIDSNKTGIFTSLDIQGDFRTAIQAAGAGAAVRSSTNDTASILVFNNSVMTERVWTSQDPLGDPISWIPCGVTSGIFNVVAGGFGGDFLIAGSTVMLTRDNESFTGQGAPPDTVNHMIWRGLSAMYTCALDSGLYQTNDFGESFGAMRPNATFGTTWPAGAEAKQVAVSIGARACQPQPPAACDDAPRYEAAVGVGLTTEYFTNDQKLSEKIIGNSDTIPDTALVTTYFEGSASINNLGKKSDSGSSILISVMPKLTDSFLFIAIVSRPGDEPDSVTDSQSLTWDQIQTELHSDAISDIRLSIYRTNANADSVLGLDITVAFPAPQDIILVIVDEWIGLDTAVGGDPVVDSNTQVNTNATPTDYPTDYLLTYVLSNTSANFNDGTITPTSFGIALQLAACGVGGIFIVKNNDVFGFDGTSVAYILTNDSNQNSGNHSWCAKTFNGKLFWHSETPGNEGMVIRSTDGGVTSIPGGNLSPEYISHFDIDAAGNLYAIVDSGATDSIYKSVDNGDSWASVLGSLNNNTFQSSIACHPTDVNRIAFIELLNGVSANLRVSTNAGSSFGTLGLSAPDTGSYFFFGFQPRWFSSGRLVWAFTEDFGDFKVQYSDDDGASVGGTQVLMAFGTFQFFYGMWVDPDGVLFVAAQDTSNNTHIFRSTDEGTSWTDLGSIGAAFSNVQGVAFSDGNMYVLNDWPEMWKIPSPGTAWVPELILDSGSPAPFGPGDTSSPNQDCFINVG